MVDELVRGRIEILEEYLRRLAEIQKLGRDEFLSDWRSQDIALRNLQTAIEVCLDLGNHLISEFGWETPKSYAAIVKILASHGVLPEAFVETAEAMARFRNVLVHGYAVIKLELVYENLQKMDDIRQFARYIVDFLQGRQGV